MIISAHFLAGDSSKAMPLLRYAEKIADSLNNLRLMETAKGVKGKVFQAYSEKDSALKYFRQAIVLGDKQSNKGDNYNWYKYISDILEDQGKYSAALDTLRLAENYALQKQDISALRKIQIKRCNTYFELSQFDLALLSLFRAKSYAELEVSKGDEFIRIYERFGDIYRIRGKLTEAIKFYYKALVLEKDKNIGDSPKAYIYNKLGSVYHQMGECQKARECYTKALYYAKKKSAVYRILYTLLNLSTCQIGKQEYQQAKSNLHKMMTYQLNKTDQQIYSKRFELLGDIYLKTDHRDSAIYYYKKGIVIADKERKKISINSFRIGLFKSQPELYLKLAHLYKIEFSKEKPSYADSVFKYINLSRARTLYDTDEKQIQKSDEVYRNTVNKFTQAQRKLRLAQGDSILQSEKLPSLRFDLLTRKMEAIQNKVSDPKPVSIVQFQAYLKSQRAAALIYCINEWDAYTLYINSDSLKFVELNVSPDMLKKDINSFVNTSFYKFDLSKNLFNAKKAYSLYQQLWQPIEQQIDLSQNIIIVPDIPILSLPFDALLSSQTGDSLFSISDEPDYRDYFLAQKHNIGYLPSPYVLTLFEKKAENNNFLAIANPVFNSIPNLDLKLSLRTGWNFEPLVFSKAEVNKIAPFFNDAQILEQEKATKQNFLERISGNNIIHLATHAFIDTVFDAFTGLVFSLSEDTLDDGLLMGYEIDRLKLNSDLIVLSACESGRGRIINGEGVMGMPRLFFNAGIRSVLMTQWKVDDKFTSEIMPVFYKNLIENGMTKMEALGEAKRMILNSNSSQNYAYPFYWAAFCLYGDTGELSAQQNLYLTYAPFLVLGILSLTLLIRKYYYKPTK